MKALAILLAFACVGFAAPAKRNWPSTSCKTTSQNASFDDLATVPATGVVPLPIPYKGVSLSNTSKPSLRPTKHPQLYYQGFGFIGVVETGLAPGVYPHSGTQYGFSDVREQTTAGSAELTVNYSGSTVKSFSLKSFYFGCALALGQGVTALPTACNIAVTAYAKGDDTTSTVQVDAQTFSYNPSTSTGAQQVAQGIFKPTFQNLQYVLVQYTLPGGLTGANPDLGLAIDDVIYTTCS